MTEIDAKALIGLCIDEGLKQGVLKNRGEFEELFDYLDKWFASTGKVTSGSSEIPNYLNELADYARRQVEELILVIKKYDDFSEEQIEELRTHLMAMFLEGAGWQKEQMLKEAVPFYEILKVVPPGPERDKVKLIIVRP